MDWIEQDSGARYRITTEGEHGNRRLVRLKSYGELLQEYEFHPESKCADSNGLPCSKQTIGLLQRRHVRMRGITPIGKESNRLEEVQAGLIHSADGVYTEYIDPRREEWQRAAKVLSLKQWEKESGRARRIVIDARRGRRRPHAKHRALLVRIARQIGLINSAMLWFAQRFLVSFEGFLRFGCRPRSGTSARARFAIACFSSR
jgi:hypothetical protein